MTFWLCPCIILLALLSVAGGAAQLPRGEWNTGWSGVQAQVQPAGEARTPDGETPLRFVWTKPADATLPNMSRNFEVLPAAGDVVAFWLRTDQPLKRLQAILLDADTVGAEQAVPGLLSKPEVPAGQWQYVVWPFRTNPGWVRYARGVVDWERLNAIAFYTWPEEIGETVTVEVGPFQMLSYAELESIFEAHPERVNSNRGIPYRVLSGKRTDLLVVEYLARRAQEKTDALRRKYPPDKLLAGQHKVRAAFAATLMRPKVDAAPVSTCVGIARVDGIAIERRLLKIADGFYSTANVYLPYDPDQGPPSRRYPAILSLPGHGDPNWAAVNQDRSLTLAKRGYISMWVEPFGQAESGDQPMWNEAHGGQSMAYLLTTGKSLLGMIMTAHEAELTDLLARQDVEPSQVGLTGISMGGSHSLWLAALDPRVKATVAISIAPMARPESCFMHHCLCDVLVGQFNAADEEMIRGLCAPRPLLHIYPDGEVPLAEEGRRKLFEGWINAGDALKQYGMNEAQLAERHGYAHQAYAAAGVPDGFLATIVPGPHAYLGPMRERAGGWFDHWLRDTPGTSPTPDPPITPLTPWRAARAELNTWPDGNRPAEVLGPTQYTQRETARLIAKLPMPPASARAWQAQRRKLAEGVRKALGVDVTPPKLKTSEAGRFTLDGAEVRKLVIYPDPDMPVPMLLFAPLPGAKPDGRMVVLLDPAGMAAAVAWPRRVELQRAGAWVLCLDPRGVGETRYSRESGAYMGFRDSDLCNTALKLGETVAGHWARDVLAGVAAAREVVGKPVAATLHGSKEMGLVALLAAGQSDTIQAVETEGLVASYHSPGGYGLTYAYSDDNGKKEASQRPLGGYGTMVTCIPGILKVADIPQLAALVAPRPLTLRGPLWASSDVVGAGDLARQFGWTAQVYTTTGAAGKLRLEAP